MGSLEGFKVVDEVGHRVLADPFGNNVAFRCLVCGAPVLAIVREHQRGSSKSNPSECPACGSEYWIRHDEASKTLMVQSVGSATGLEVAPDGWSPWRPFPDPRRCGALVAPLGPGVYELRLAATQEGVLTGSGKNCAYRMTSLLAAPLGQGTRRNEKKKSFVLERMAELEYRTRAFASEEDAEQFESQLLRSGQYLFPT
jgi:hypothetical protein